MKVTEIITEAASAAQQAAIAISMKKAHKKPKNESTELVEEFDLIESIIERLAEHNGVDAEVIWEDLETLTEDELYAFAVTSEPIMEGQGVAEGSKESYIIVRTDSEGKKDVFAGNFDTYEQAQKELDDCLAHPLHTKYKQKFEIKRKGGEQGMAEAYQFKGGFSFDVDHMPGPTIKRTQTGCKRCHGKGYVYKTPDGQVHPMNRPDAKTYKCGKCGGIGFVKVTDQGMAEDWQKANKRDRTDGMSQKAVNAYRRENPGSKLKTAVTTKPSKLKKGGKASKRRKSYCSRSRGQMKMHSISCAKTPDKAICKARRRWNC
jgi:hypothetical protein